MKFFAPAYEDILAQRLEGIISGLFERSRFSSDEFCSASDQFEFDAFVLAAHGTGKRSSKDAFLDGLAERFADETDLICAALETANVTEAIVCRVRTLYERVRSWSCSQTRFALASAALEEALAEGSRIHVWCRNKKLFVQFLEKAREAFAQANAGNEQNTTEEAESLVSVPSVEERREVLTGAAGMIARAGRFFLSVNRLPVQCLKAKALGHGSGIIFRNFTLSQITIALPAIIEKTVNGHF